MKGLRGAIGLALFGLLLGGCAVVPTSGPVHPAPGVVAGAGEPIVGVIARPPQNGMSPTDIVSGFLDAMASPTDNFAIARLYLTAERSTAWNPAARTVVYDGPGSVDQDRSHVVHLTAPSVGVIDAQSRWQAAVLGAQISVSFTLTREGNNWRIASNPDGLLLTGGDIARGYRGFPIYFVAPSGKTLVADGAVLPVEATNTATMLTTLLLKGPATWLTGAVSTEFPRGTALALDSVPVINGVAQVALTSNVLRATSNERRLLAAQLASTLEAIPGVFDVAISVLGQPLPIPGVGATIAVDHYAALMPDSQSPLGATFVGKSGIMTYEAGNVATLRGASRAFVVANPIRNVAHTRIAGIRSDKSLVMARVNGTGAVVLPGSSGASDLMFDRSGRTWALRNGQLLAWDASATPVPVIEPASLRIDRFSLAPDGVRIALSRVAGGANQLVVGSLVRRPDGLHLQGLHPVSRNAATPFDVAWADEINIAVLTAAPANSIVTVNAISGENTAIVSVPTAIDITASARGGILVGTAGGAIWNTGVALAQKVANGTEPSFGE